jgi:hypothetical protein
MLLSKITQKGVNKFKQSAIYIFEGRNAVILLKQSHSNTGLDNFNLTFTRGFIYNDSK